MQDESPSAFESLLKTLSKSSVEYVVVGGVAGVIHGSVRLTQDLDIVYRRTSDNIERLVSALEPHEPTFGERRRDYRLFGMPERSNPGSTLR